MGFAIKGQEEKVLKLKMLFGLKQAQGHGIPASTKSYAKKVLEKFKMFDCNPVNTPMEVALNRTRKEDEKSEVTSVVKEQNSKMKYKVCPAKDTKDYKIEQESNPPLLI
ncbi:hypothetical protein CR513_31143, partial [Mucuna pruriens]